MNLRLIVERLRIIRSRWKGKGSFDYNTMFEVKRDAEEAIYLVEAHNANPNAIAEFKRAIELSESETKEEDNTKKEAIGALEHGIELFFDRA